MLLTKQLTSDLYVAGQITVADVAEAAKQGFTAIINNRPDHEEEGQPLAQDIEAAARELGIKYLHQPVAGAQLGPDDAATFDKLVSEISGKVLAHCRTGTRCTMLWVLSQSGKRPADDILETAKAAGYNLEHMREQLRT